MPRGIYAIEDEEAPWLRERLVFTSKAECTAWMEAHVEDKTHPSNPTNPHLEHIFTFLTSWDEIERFLLPKIDEYDRRFPVRVAPDISASNVFATAAAAAAAAAAGELPAASGGGGSPPSAPAATVAGVVAALRARLDLPMHARMNRQSTRNTLSYLFHHMRCGIYVMIRAGQLRMFVPFVNKDYTNTWSEALRWKSPSGDLGQDVAGYYEQKERAGGRRENVIPDVAQWWANGNIVCNEHCPPGVAHSQYWGDQLLVPLRDMLHTLCAERAVADCEFFVNKRDYPQLKVHVGPPQPPPPPASGAAAGAAAAASGAARREAVAVEPYGFIYDRDDRDPAQVTSLAWAKTRIRT